MRLLFTTLRVARRELHRIGDSKGLYLLIVVTPLVLFTLLTYLYSDRVVQNIPVAVCDFDQSQLSRLLVRSMESTRSVTISHSVRSLDEIREALRAGEIHGALVCPHGMENDVKAGKSVTVIAFANTANLVLGNLITKEFLQVSRTVSAGIVMKKLQSGGSGEETALNLANPIRVEVHSIGNPSYNYQSYMVSGLLPFVFQLIVIVGSVLCINSEHRDGTFGKLIRTAEGRVSAIIGGKFLAHLGVHTVSLLCILVALFPLQGVEGVDSYLTVLAFSLCFAAVTICLGMVISAFSRDQVLATEIASFATIPSFIFSGFTFPLWGMPDLHVFYAHLLPFTYYMNGFVKAYFLNSPWENLLPEIGALALFAILAIVPLVWALKRQLKTCPECLDESGATT